MPMYKQQSTQLILPEQPALSPVAQVKAQLELEGFRCSERGLQLVNAVSQGQKPAAQAVRELVAYYQK